MCTYNNPKASHDMYSINYNEWNGSYYIHVRCADNYNYNMCRCRRPILQDIEVVIKTFTYRQMAHVSSVNVLNTQDMGRQYSTM